MSKKFKIGLMTAAAVASLGVGGVAAAQGIVYMTGTSNPWGQTTNDVAMNTVFGAGNWTKFNGFDASVFNPGNSFIFFDGSDGNGSQFASFISGNLSSLTNFVNNGGRILANAAFNVGPSTLDMGFGHTLLYGPNYSGSGSLTAAGIAAGLDANGAGTNFTGNFFAHNAVTGGTCLITGTAGCILAGGGQGAGAYFVGGQTTTNFHNPQPNATRLRENELRLVANFQGGPGAVPEPGTWAMLLVGFGLAGAALRRRKEKVTTRVSFA